MVETVVTPPHRSRALVDRPCAAASSVTSGYTQICSVFPTPSSPLLALSLWLAWLPPQPSALGPASSSSRGEDLLGLILAHLCQGSRPVPTLDTAPESAPRGPAGADLLLTRGSRTWTALSFYEFKPLLRYSLWIFSISFSAVQYCC